MHYKLLIALAVHLGSHTSALPVTPGSSDTDWYADSAQGLSSSLDTREDAGTDWYSDSAQGISDSLAAREEISTDWYADSAQGVAESLGKRDTAGTDWYADSAQGVSESLGKRENAETDWYADSAQGIAESVQKREDASSDWYADSADGVAKAIGKREEASTDWYADSAEGIASSIQRREDGATDWYADSAQGVAESIEKRADAETDWYADSAQGLAESIAARETADTDWYADSAAGISNSVSEKKRDDSTDWYADSAQGVASTLDKRGMSYEEKESYELDLRRWIYNNMRSDSLRESSERGKALFQFTVKPRYDYVDRFHVPHDLEPRYNHAKNDAERVSVLNYYLMVTGREPKSAEDLGFTPTASEPGLVEENEVGYGYALGGQHQYHCVNFVADAIDIGKDNINDFYLKHTIHCLGLLKYLAPNLTMKQPLAFLRAPANARIQAGYQQTINDGMMWAQCRH